MHGAVWLRDEAGPLGYMAIGVNPGHAAESIDRVEVTIVESPALKDIKHLEAGATLVARFQT